MIGPAQQLIAAATTGLLALILILGSVIGWLLGRQVPEWLIGFDGVIVAAAFSTGAFFYQARTAAPTAAALADVTGKYHELAMASTTQTTPTQSGGTTSSEHNGGA